MGAAPGPAESGAARRVHAKIETEDGPRVRGHGTRGSRGVAEEGHRADGESDAAAQTGQRSPEARRRFYETHFEDTGRAAGLLGTVHTTWHQRRFISRRRGAIFNAAAGVPRKTGRVRAARERRACQHAPRQRYDRRGRTAGEDRGRPAGHQQGGHACGAGRRCPTAFPCWSSARQDR